MPEPAYETRPLREDERDWLSEVLLERRGRALIVGRGRVRQLSERSPPAPAAHSRIDDWAPGPRAQPRRAVGAPGGGLSAPRGPGLRIAESMTGRRPMASSPEPAGELAMGLVHKRGDG